jgi:hypothetical protein
VCENGILNQVLPTVNIVISDGLIARRGRLGFVVTLTRLGAFVLVIRVVP